jgi:hypothetical protein
MPGGSYWPLKRWHRLFARDPDYQSHLAELRQLARLSRTA